MAKKTTGASKPAAGRSAEAAALDFAEDLGRLLGTTQKKAEEWLGQRKALAEKLAHIRDAANGYLQQLTVGVTEMAAAVQKGRRGRPPGSQNQAAPAPGKRKRKPMSAAARKAVGERMKKDRAARKKAAK